MAKITFKAKVRHVYNMDDSHAYDDIKVPVLTKAHCDMGAFRCHPKFGGFANSDMFPSILARASKALFPSGYVRLDRPLPEGVTLDQSGFLAIVTMEI